MALEDEIINIENLNLVDEIKVGDQILLETSDGTKLIDFKDFIIGVENVTFYDKLTGIDTTVTDNLSAKLNYHETLLESISGVYNDINTIRTRLGSLESNYSGLNFTVKSVDSSSISEYTTGKIGFTLTTTSKTATNSNGLVFSTISFKGSDLVENTDVSKGDSSNTAFYKAKGSYGLLLNGSFEFSHTAQGSPGVNRANNPYLDLYKNNTKVMTFPGSTYDSRTSFITINHYIDLVADDKITLVASGIRNVYMEKGSLAGIRI